MPNKELLRLVKQAEALCEKESWVDALVLAERVAARWPEEMLSLYIQGRARWGKGDYIGALLALNTAIMLDDSFAKTHHYRGNALYALKRYYEALSCFDRAIEIDPQYAYPYNGKGNLLLDQKHYDEALACYDRAIEIDPQFVDAYNGKGTLLQDQKRYDEALACYDRAIEIDPQFAHAYNNKGNTLRSLKRYGDAMTCFDSAIKINPAFSGYYYNRALLFEDIHLNNKAIDNYQKCLSITPDFSQAQDRLDLLRGEPEQPMAESIATPVLPTEEETQRDKAKKAVARFKASEEKKETWLPSAIDILGVLPLERILRFHSDKRNSDIYNASIKKKQDFSQFTAPQVAPDDVLPTFHILRRWNSYTPIVDKSGIHSRGGGYFLHLGKDGVVIDPGFDFIENFMEAKFTFSQISKIFITHAHNDHDADLESILTLLYIYNQDVQENILRDLENEAFDGKIDGQEAMTEDAIFAYLKREKASRFQKQRKMIDIYLSVSAFKKHAAKLNLNQNGDYRVHVVDPDNKPIPCGKGITVTPIPAKHFDLISDCDALGFIVEFEKFALVYTGDTGFTPEIGKAYMDIRTSYEDKSKPLALLAHLGGFKERENDPDNTRLRNGEAFYKDHLGRNGLICLVDLLRPAFCIVSEFGEEFEGNREVLTQLLTDIFSDLPIPFIPADIGLCLDIDMNIWAIIESKHDITDGAPHLTECFINAASVCSLSVPYVDSLVYHADTFQGELLYILKGDVQRIRGKK